MSVFANLAHSAPACVDCPAAKSLLQTPNDAMEFAFHCARTLKPIVDGVPAFLTRELQTLISASGAEYAQQEMERLQTFIVDISCLDPKLACLSALWTMKIAHAQAIQQLGFDSETLFSLMQGADVLLQRIALMHRSDRPKCPIEHTALGGCWDLSQSSTHP